MSAEEERLSWLLKNAVPQPPAEMTADQVTSRRPADRSVKSWALPALAAAAVVAIGVTIGVVSQRQAGPGSPTPLAGAGTVTRQPTPGSSPQPATSCQGTTVIVPNVIGADQDAATAIVQGVGLEAAIYWMVPPASQAAPPGTVFAQSLPAGSRAVPGAEVQLAIAVAPSTSTAAPIDPGFAPVATVSPTPMSPCQAISGTPPAQWRATARVPDVIGMTQAQAVAVAEAAGFSVSVTHGTPPTAQHVVPGTVFAQSPAAGSSARSRSGMILYVAAASLPRRSPWAANH